MVLNLNNFQLVSQGTKFFKQIWVSGSYQHDLKKKNGNGNIRADLKESLDPMLNKDITTEGTVNVTPREVGVELANISGENVSGSGNILLTLDPGNPSNMQNARLSGVLKIKAEGASVDIRLSGTVAEPTAVPDIKLE